MNTSSLRPAARAFDAVAPHFDARFGTWQSVAAQRRAVRRCLVERFPAGGRLLEIGGGTGEDAAFLSERGFSVLSTDPSPTMVSLACEKLAISGSSAEITFAEELHEFADKYLATKRPLFNGAFSNFAPLNCVRDLNPVAKGLAALLKPGSAVMLVLFGTFCPSEMAVEIIRRRPRAVLRRFRRNGVFARLGRCEFEVFYHRHADLLRAFAPWFVLERRVGIGITVPPSAAEPWISRHPGLLASMEKMDHKLARPLARLGDHVLYQFRRHTCVSNHVEHL
jgi:SAM-dependent methyltransferase